MGVQRCVIVGHTGSISVVVCVIYGKSVTPSKNRATLYGPWEWGCTTHTHRDKGVSHTKTILCRRSEENIHIHTHTTWHWSGSSKNAYKYPEGRNASFFCFSAIPSPWIICKIDYVSCHGTSPTHENPCSGPCFSPQSHVLSAHGCGCKSHGFIERGAQWMIWHFFCKFLKYKLYIDQLGHFSNVPTHRHPVSTPLNYSSSRKGDALSLQEIAYWYTMMS